MQRQPALLSWESGSGGKQEGVRGMQWEMSWGARRATKDPREWGGKSNGTHAEAWVLGNSCENPGS